ncbi:MAG: hypothetical protein Q7J71_01450 [Polaromonas sp.]|nr:hypothetical protein [Polaromonas sp.]
MRNDSRCCGAGTCLINADGYCWCGQRWDGEKMYMPAPDLAQEAKTEAETELAKDAPASRPA